MEKRTLLEIINDCMISMDYETVSLIGDTEESERVSALIRNEYSKLMDRDDWPHLNIATELTALSDVTRPNFMQVPTTVASVNVIKYDTTEAADTDRTMTDITVFEDPDDFLEVIYGRNTSDSNVTIFNTAEAIPIWTFTDQAPTCCTSFDDDIIVFDAYNSAEDTTMQASKSLVLGLRGSAWTEDENFVPHMPVNMFSMFTSKCKVVCNEVMRQVTLTTEARDHQVAVNRLARKKRINKKVSKPNYGRNK